MIDRERAIADVLLAQGWTCDMHEPDEECADCQRLYAETAKAIFALPDPVHEAARKVIAHADAAVLANRNLSSLELAVDDLRAALSAERIPTPVTDEMVERASAMFASWRPSRPTHREAMRAALDAALNGGKR